MKKKTEAEKELLKRTRELEELTDDLAYFARESFMSYLRAVMSAVTGASRTQDIKLSLYAKPDGSVAATSGFEVLVNLLAPMILKAKTRTERFLVIIGLLTHECGHLLFSDFVELNSFLKAFQAKAVLPVKTPEAEKIQEECMNDPGLRQYMSGQLAGWQNLLEDRFIERMLRLAFAGIPKIGLLKAREIASEECPPLKELLDKNKRFSEAFCSVWLHYIGTGEIKGKDEARRADPAAFEAFMEVFERTKEWADKHYNTEEAASRSWYASKFFIEIYPLLKAEYEEMKADSGESEDSEEPSESESGKGGASGGIPGTPPESKDGENDGKSEAGDGGSSESSSKSEPSKSKSKGSGKSGGTGKAGAKPSGGSDDDGSDARRMIAPMPKCEKRPERGIYANSEDSEAEVPDLDDAKAAAVAELDAERMEAEFKELTKAAKDAGVKNRKFMLQRTSVITKAMRSDYEREYAEVKLLSKRTTRLLSNVLKERQVEGRLNGQLYGKRIDCRTAYRRDGRIFTRELVPDGAPDVAFCILVDESGSMTIGCRDEMARRSAILLEDVLRTMEVPFAIVGHTADIPTVGKVNLMPYAPFDTYDKNDRYRLSEIVGRDNNHDLAAIVYCGELLKKRPEAQKVLIVISDGCPYASRFDGESAIKMTAKAVNELTDAGIEVFGAAIDGCARDVSRIYGEKRTMDIRNLDQLPTELLKVVKRYLLKRRA